jgi:NitT/TauT family transport system permease protein
MRAYRPWSGTEAGATPSRHADDLWSDRAIAPGRSFFRTLASATAPPVAALIVLLILWMGIIRWKDTSPLIAPSPGDVVNAFRDNAPDIFTALWSTMLDAAAGLALSTVIGIGLALVMSQSKLLERAIYPFTTLAQTIPVFAIAPLIGTMVGGGHTPVITVSLIIAVFPIIANATLGLTSVDPNHVSLFRLYNASRRQELLYLRLPYALPYILTGIRVSSGLAIIGVIVGEVLLGNGGPQGGGLGYEIWFAANQGLWGLLGASALAAGLLGILVFAGLGGIGSLALRHWHESAVARET